MSAKKAAPKKKRAVRKVAKKKVARKRVGGRPTAYRVEYAELGENYALLGATDVEMAGFFGVCEKTFNNWKARHPKFLQSIKRGKEIADARVGRKLYERACGFVCKETKIATFEGQITDTLDVEKHYPPDTAAGIFWLTNRQRGKWRHKVQHEHEHEAGDGLMKLLKKVRKS